METYFSRHKTSVVYQTIIYCAKPEARNYTHEKAAVMTFRLRVAALLFDIFPAGRMSVGESQIKLRTQQDDSGNIQLSSSIGSMLGQCWIHWAIIDTMLGQWMLFTGEPDTVSCLIAWWVRDIDPMLV